MSGLFLPPVVCRRTHVVSVVFVFCVRIVVCFCFVLLRLICPMLPISLDYPFLIAPLIKLIIALTV